MHLTMRDNVNTSGLMQQRHLHCADIEILPNGNVKIVNPNAHRDLIITGDSDGLARLGYALLHGAAVTKAKYE